MSENSGKSNDPRDVNYVEPTLVDTSKPVDKAAVDDGYEPTGVLADPGVDDPFAALLDDLFGPALQPLAPATLTLDDDTYVATVPLPDTATKDNVNVNVAGGTLVVDGVFPVYEGEGDDRTLVDEEVYVLNLPLPTPVDVDKVDATLDDSTLTVHLPKSGDSWVKNIKVS